MQGEQVEQRWDEVRGGGRVQGGGAEERGVRAVRGRVRERGGRVPEVPGWDVEPRGREVHVELRGAGRGGGRVPGGELLCPARNVQDHH